MKMIDAATVRELLDYDPAIGVFRWRRKTGSKPAGSAAGTPHKGGYCLRIMIDRKCYRSHRLAWLYMTGAWPDFEVDHRNTDGTDNRWENLRPSTRAGNMQNQRRAHRNNKVGFLGVHQQGERFRARLRVAGKSASLGMFATAEEAHAAYVRAKRELHPGCTL